MFSKRTTTVLMMALAALTLSACGRIITFTDSRRVVRGSGNVVEETRQVSGFHGVELISFGDIVVTLGDEEGLRIEAEDNLLKYVETEVRFGILEISTSSRSVRLKPTEPVTFYLTVKEIDTVSITGSGDIQVPNLETGEFSISITGSGDVTMEALTVDEFQVEVAGSGDVYVENLIADNVDVNFAGSGSVEVGNGTAAHQDINITGSGSYLAGDLESASADVVITGSGNVTFWVTESMDVNILGSGEVVYYGEPSVSSTRAGSGRLTGRGEK